MFFWPASSLVVSKSMLVYMEAFTGYYYTLQVLPGRAGPQANWSCSTIHGRAQELLMVLLAQQSGVRCGCCVMQRHCEPGRCPATASLSEQRRYFQWFLQKYFYKTLPNQLRLQVMDNVTVTTELIEETAAFLAYIILYVIHIFKKQNKTNRLWY